MNLKTAMIYISQSANNHTKQMCYQPEIKYNNKSTFIQIQNDSSLFILNSHSFLKLKGGYFSSVQSNSLQRTISSCLILWGPVTWLGSRVNWLSLCPPVNYKHTSLFFFFLLSLYLSDFLSHSLSLRGASSGSSRLSSAQCGLLSLSSQQPRQSPDALMQAELALFVSAAYCSEREHQSSCRKCVLYCEPVWVNMADEKRQTSQGVNDTNKQPH